MTNWKIGDKAICMVGSGWDSEKNPHLWKVSGVPQKGALVCVEGTQDLGGEKALLLVGFSCTYLPSGKEAGWSEGAFRKVHDAITGPVRHLA